MLKAKNAHTVEGYIVHDLDHVYDLDISSQTDHFLDILYVIHRTDLGSDHLSIDLLFAVRGLHRGRHQVRNEDYTSVR